MDLVTYSASRTQQNKPVSEIGPPSSHFAITPSDTNAFAWAIREVRVGTGGNVALRMQDGTVVTYVGCYAGEYISGNFIQVMATNTTASDLVGRY